MKLILASLLTASMLVGGTRLVVATTVTVPTQQPTITAAIASPADTALVLPGVYPEHVIVNRSVVLLAGGGPVHVRSVRSSGAGSATVVVLGFRSDRQIQLTANNITVEDCWADSTMTCNGTSNTTMKNCRVFGAAQALGLTTTVIYNRVFGGGLVADGESVSMVTDNYIEGPAAIGLRTGADTYPYRNVVRNCTVGIQAGCDVFVGVNDNVVLDCGGNGIESPAGGPGCSGGSYSGNLVLRCGGDGMRIDGTNARVFANRVDQAGGTGIFVNATTFGVNDNDVRGAGGDGIRVATLVQDFLRNRAVQCQQDGFEFVGGGPVIGNIAGHNHGDGFHIDASGGFHLRMQSNTSYLNTGDAYDVTSNGSSPDTVDRVIGYGSSAGYGLRWTLAGGFGPVRICNDWYGNSLGSTTGVTPGATDIASDPRLCDPVREDVALTTGSPALNPPGCGRIGAVALGCVTAVSVAEGPPATPQGALRVMPLPSSGAIHFTWPKAPGDQRLEIIDATGARRWSATVSGMQGGNTWDGRGGDGRLVPPGIYFARLSRGAVMQETRFVIVR